MYKWKVSFTTPRSGAMILKETIEATDWFHAKAMIESKYIDVKIVNYTPAK
jgi:hypothetical protein